MVLCLSVSCATVLHGPTQDIAISSEPSGARVTIDGQARGVTPVVAMLTRKTSHTVRVELPGYEPAEQALTASPSAWTAMNAIFLPGLAVDAMSGAMWQLSEQTIHVRLVPVAGAGRVRR